MRRSSLAAHIFLFGRSLHPRIPRGARIIARPLAASCVLTFRAALCFFCGRLLYTRSIGEFYCFAPCSGREENSSHAAAGSSAAVHSRMQ